MVQPPAKKDRKFSLLFYNAVTYVGVFLTLLVFLVECFLFGIDFFAHDKNLYLGLLTYLVLPPFLLFGLFLIPLGALWKKRRVRKGKTTLEPRVLRIDPSIPAHRNSLLVFITGTGILVIMSLIGAYKSFQYTESVKFCGLLCHQIMHPEYTVYLNSPHGKVKCVACHIGEGAGWYLRSKVSGSRQVLRAMSNTYSRPIHTPVKDLRPAADTCLECHSPGKLFSTMDFDRTYYLTEKSAPSPWRMRMLMNVGGGGDQSYGVHAHMNQDRDIYYAAEDERRQKITWIKSVDKNEKVEIFVSPGSKFKETPPSVDQIRKMDCIDCHNRPTHQFVAPYRLMNKALKEGQIDSAIPQIKEKGLQFLSQKAATKKEGMDAISSKFTAFYQEKYPDYYEKNKPAIAQASSAIAEMYSKNIFPEMKVRWDTHPDNIGHLVSQGCFRCHDGEHKSPEGRLITRDCNACHRIVEQGPVGAVEKNIDGLEFKHPTDIEDQWKETNCSDCHTGA